MRIAKTIPMLLIMIALAASTAGAGFTPEISVSRDWLTFGYDPSTVSTGTQFFQIENAGTGDMNWLISTDQSWLHAGPPTGSNSGSVGVSVDPTGLAPGSYWGHVTVTVPGASNSPFNVSVNLEVYDTPRNPFGDFSTPVDGSTVRSSVAVTGWALDDVGVESVKIYRSTLGGGNDLVYVGDASFVEGARPDVEQANPGYPNNYRAGWGYMMLTNFLPNGGNGSFTISAIATDREGNGVTLGTKTILCDNANAVKPFGAIDTPAQGGTASGSKFDNWGWILTPQPNKIPTDGSTIDVFIDGVNVGHPTYNVYRQDIADNFPEYANSGAAAGYFQIDTEAYANGVYTIEWIARDDAGNADGIGSRYFRIHNSDNPTVSVHRTRLTFGMAASGSKSGSQTLLISNAGPGDLNWAATSDKDWLVCNPASGVNSGNVQVSVDDGTLAPGTHTGTITVSDPGACNSPQTVTVNLNVYDTGMNKSPFGSFDSPKNESTVTGSIPFTGWVLDDVGVETVKIFRDPVAGESGGVVYVGDATFVEGARPDVQQAYPGYPSSHKAGWGYMMLTNFLPDGGNGTFLFYAKAEDTEGNHTLLGTKIIACDNANAVKPFGAIDSPGWGEVAKGHAYHINGWALTPLPGSLAEDGSEINVYVDGVNLGHPTYNQHRSDIAALFPAHANSHGAGWTFKFDTRDFEDGIHSRWFTIQNTGGKLTEEPEKIGVGVFIIQNDHPLTGVDDAAPDGLPAGFVLHPAFPNPFNPSTRIRYDLPEKTRVSLTVYDILGRRVRKLVDGTLQESGRNTVEWNGRTASESPAPSGVYLILLEAGSALQTQKVILLR